MYEILRVATTEEKLQDAKDIFDFILFEITNQKQVLTHVMGGQNKTGLDHIDKHVYPRMFGYKNDMDYYEQCSVDARVKNIAVPTFAFDAKDDVLVAIDYLPIKDIEGQGS